MHIKDFIHFLWLKLEILKLEINNSFTLLLKQQYETFSDNSSLKVVSADSRTQGTEGHIIDKWPTNLNPNVKRVSKWPKYHVVNLQRGEFTSRPRSHVCLDHVTPLNQLVFCCYSCWFGLSYGSSTGWWKFNRCIHAPHTHGLCYIWMNN